MQIKTNLFFVTLHKKMIVYPNAKINLGLHVTNKRADGFHDIESLFLPIPLCDILEFTPLKDSGADTHFTCSGISVDCDEADNLVLKAYRLLQDDHALPPIQLHLHKRIPLGAGLGGGSADAAFMLKALNQAFSLSLSSAVLEDYAARIGSDCPFFINNQPALAYGRGTELRTHPSPLPACQLVIVYPGIHVSTKEAYAGITPRMPKRPIHEIVHPNTQSHPTQGTNTWKKELVNDFENAVFPKHPCIRQIKEALYAAGACYASMSGSGSAVFGIFDSSCAQQLLSEYKKRGYFVWEGSLP